MPKLRRPATSTYPEPGAWVLDTSQELPKLQPPAAFPHDRKLEAYEIRDDYVAYEGLGFCLYSYVPPEAIADAALARLWNDARIAMQRVVNYLEKANRPTKIRKLKQQKNTRKDNPMQSTRTVTVGRSL